MQKIITVAVILFIAIAILIGLTRQISDSLTAGSRLDEAVQIVSDLQQQNRDLKKELSEVNTDEYKEEILRNKLNMQKPNETIIVIPDELINKVMGANTKKEEPKLENWQGWLKLIFH